METNDGMLQKFLKFIGYLRPAMSINPVTGEPSFSLQQSIASKPESLEAMLDYIESKSRKRPILVSLDEFQDTLCLKDHSKLHAILRTKIQTQQDVPYIFSGSDRSGMEDIFSNPDAPFYKTASTLHVGEIRRELFEDFIIRKFKTTKNGVAREALEAIFEVAENTPGDVQQLCAAIWENIDNGEEIIPDVVKRALKTVFASEMKGYESVVSQLTNTQLGFLKALAVVGGASVYGKRFMEAAGLLTPSHITRALNRLIKIRVVVKHGNIVKFCNPFFKMWLQYECV